MRARSGSREGIRIRGWLALVVTIAGCRYDTAIYGLYFPSWVVAPVVGAGAAALTLAGLARTRLDPYVSSGIVLFTALALIYAVLLWALFFDA